MTLLNDCESGPTGIEAQVCQDIARRQQTGVAKYGMTVATNPLPLREWLMHAYEETLDKAVYLRRAIDDIDTSPALVVQSVKYLAGEMALIVDDKDPDAREIPHSIAAGDVVKIVAVKKVG